MITEYADWKDIQTTEHSQDGENKFWSATVRTSLKCVIRPIRESPILVTMDNAALVFVGPHQNIVKKQMTITGKDVLEVVLNELFSV